MSRGRRRKGKKGEESRVEGGGEAKTVEEKGGEGGGKQSLQREDVKWRDGGEGGSEGQGIGVVGSVPEGEGGGGEESLSISHTLRHPSERQCYLEMKTNYAKQFSILLFLFLWFRTTKNAVPNPNGGYGKIFRKPCFHTDLIVSCQQCMTKQQM